MSTKRQHHDNDDATAGLAAHQGLHLTPATPNAPCQQRSFLIDGEMQTVRLPPDLWMALDDIGRVEAVMVAFIVEQVAQHCRPRASLASALRSFILAFYRQD
ncbi:ribbon-helix-helix domain-containing protein [Niveispirillum sp.]|uniref:ribbon-helix-helix domain-containing protein n=1 Tax=Niveispirillum sp. TaxID=1917217 RepID=UPI001B42F775|nr:ribbon-helix-helix domain-containing protein [Niveispirillum sp.]MBP7336775.1 ribbon-helix-helix domain-containing protein [Niveispirillum sp.]